MALHCFPLLANKSLSLLVMFVSFFFFSALSFFLFMLCCTHVPCCMHEQITSYGILLILRIVTLASYLQLFNHKSQSCNVLQLTLGLHSPGLPWPQQVLSSTKVYSFPLPGGRRAIYLKFRAFFVCFNSCLVLLSHIAADCLVFYDTL